MLGELPKHYLYLNPKRTFEYYADTCLPQKPVPPHTLVVTVDDEICLKTPVRDGFQEVASWGLSIPARTELSSEKIRVYRTAAPTI